MFCPNCHSSSVVGPEYHGGGRRKPRRAAVMNCRTCNGHFNAYSSFGSAEVAAGAFRAAGLTF